MLFLYISCDSDIYCDFCLERINQEAKYVIFIPFLHSYNTSLGDDHKRKKKKTQPKFVCSIFRNFLAFTKESICYKHLQNLASKLS